MQDPPERNKPSGTEPSVQRVRHLTVSDQDDGQRLDNWLLRQAKGVPKSHIYKLVRSGQVRINGGRAKVSVRLATGDVVRMPPMQLRAQEAARVPDRLLGVLKASVVMETDDFLVINKPPGIAVHGGSGLAFGAIDGLRQALNSPNLELAHRLDRATSGALLVARDRRRCRVLQEQFRTRLVGKHYVALVCGNWPDALKTVNLPLSANSEHAGERRVLVDPKNGKPSTTHMTVAERFADACLLDIQLETGRTHQIRVHSASKGHPIIGDERYGGNQENQRFRRMGLNRLYLHSSHIAFEWDGERVSCEVPVDADWLSAVERLRHFKK